MEIASLGKYSFLKKAKSAKDYKRNLLFFMPTEELHGANIFQRLSHNYQVVQPYLEMIDADFIQLMNSHVRNIATYLDPKVVINFNIKFILENSQER
mmetsp:Transcript_26611/g.40611  ORF Transcript_26611/g.40611 Transcript_26611/m.40611 type:complete len:97 (+) Transcript_26611:4808-5098(+)